MTNNKEVKEAKIYINGKIAGSYTRYPEQTYEKFIDEVYEAEAYCIREAYHKTNKVNSEIKYK
jgi:hypothetical protein